MVTQDEINQKVIEHGVQLQQLSKDHAATIGETRGLVRELHDLTGTLKVYIEKSDVLSESNKRLWAQHESLDARLDNVEKQQAVNQPIIEGLRSLNSKVLTVIITTAGTGLCVIAAIGYKAFTS